MSKSKFAERAAATKKMLGAAAQLAKKQAELATLNNMTLPKLYYAIGKAIVGRENLPADLAVHRDRIRALEAGIAAKQNEPKSAAAEGFAAKAKQFAQQAAKKAAKATADATATMQIQAAYVALGGAACTPGMEWLLSEPHVSDLRRLSESRGTLLEEIHLLAATSSTRLLTPGRLLVVFGSLACMGGFLLFSARTRTEKSSVEQSAVPLRATPQVAAAVRDLPARQGVASRPASTPQSPVATPIAVEAIVASFEAECDRVCTNCLRAHAAAANSTWDLVVSAGDELREIGSGREKAMGGVGIEAGCDNAVLSYLGTYGLLAIEAAAKSGGQELPNGGIVGMMESILRNKHESLNKSGNTKEYWTHMAFVRASIKLYADANVFNEDFERQLVMRGSQQVVIPTLQHLRREIHDLLIKRYPPALEYGLRKYGPPPFPEE